MKTEWLFDNYPFISTDKLTLCQIQPTESDALIDLLSDPVLRQYNSLTQQYDRFTISSFFRQVESAFHGRKGVLLGVFFNDNLNELLGTIQIHNLDPQTDSVEVGFSLRSRFRGKGIATMAVSAIVKFLFERVDVNRIQATAMAENLASERVLLGCGFTKEGTARSAVYWEGKGVISLSTYSVLKSEYPLIRGSGLVARDAELSIVRMTGNDFETMARWLSDEKVLKYYDGRDNPSDLAKIIAEYSPRISDDSPVTPCIIRENGINIGYIQFYPIEGQEKTELKAESYRTPYGIDLFIGEEQARGRGVGPKVIRMMCNYLFRHAGADVVVSDPQKRNTRSVNTFLKCGFHQVAVLPDHELHEGKMETCLIMHRLKD